MQHVDITISVIRGLCSLNLHLNLKLFLFASTAYHAHVIFRALSFPIWDVSIWLLVFTHCLCAINLHDDLELFHLFTLFVAFLLHDVNTISPSYNALASENFMWNNCKLSFALCYFVLLLPCGWICQALMFTVLHVSCSCFLFSCSCSSYVSSLRRSPSSLNRMAHCFPSRSIYFTSTSG